MNNLFDKRRTPYSCQQIDDADLKAVAEFMRNSRLNNNFDEGDIGEVMQVLKSDWLTQGPEVPEFEREVSNFLESPFALAVSNATSGLHIACMSLGVTKGDIVWTSPNSFVASSNCAIYCGAKVDFIDIDSETYNISIEKLEEKLLLAEKNGCLPKVVIPVHFGGLPCDMEKISMLGKRFGFGIIEDASHAIGARYNGNFVGSCLHSDIAVFSFHPVKIFTTGEGGLITTRDPDIYSIAKRLRSHGITSEKALMSNKPDDEIWNYQQLNLGFNYRLTDLAAALGRSQLRKIDNFQSKRNTLAAYYDQFFDRIGVPHQIRNENYSSSHHLYVVRIEKEKFKLNRNELYMQLHKSGIGVNIHYIPIYLQPFYQGLGFKKVTVLTLKNTTMKQLAFLYIQIFLQATKRFFASI